MQIVSTPPSPKLQGAEDAPLTTDQLITKPPADLVRRVRERHGFTQVQCAYIVGCGPRTWQRYEQRDGAMDLGIWWCFLLRISEITPGQLPPVPPRQRAGAMVYLKREE